MIWEITRCDVLYKNNYSGHPENTLRFKKTHTQDIIHKHKTKDTHTTQKLKTLLKPETCKHTHINTHKTTTTRQKTHIIHRN